MSNIKVTKKINHDSLWAKVRDSETKSEAKVYIGRNGTKISFKAVPSQKEFFKGVASKMAEIIKANGDLTYGEKIVLIAETFS